MKTIYEQKILDPHIHLWDLNKFSYDWIKENPNVSLKKNYLLKDFTEDINSLKVNKIVHIQAEINRKFNVEETKWLQFISDNHSKGFPNGIIGYIDLLNDNAERELNQHMVYSNFRGIRQILKYDYKNDNVNLNLLSNDKWVNKLGILSKNNLIFELLINYYQYQDAIKVIKKYPNLQFIINHTVWPIGVNSNNFEIWKKSIVSLSKLENTVIKLSGFGERDASWDLENIKPFIEYSLEKFKIERCMFGSNFPVDKSFCQKTYIEYWDAYHTIISNFSDSEKNYLFFKNAEKIYKI